MTWQKWVLVVVLLLQAVSVISRIGKPRTPITSEEAGAVLLLCAAMVALVVYA